MEKNDVILELIEYVEAYFEAEGPDELNPLHEDQANKMFGYVADTVLSNWSVLEPILRAGLLPPDPG